MQRHTDCILIVFRYITGEEDDVALSRFFPHLNGGEGISVDALKVCLKEAGYTLALYDKAMESDVVIDNYALTEFWKPFQGQAVILYEQGQEMSHAVLVRSGGTVYDPSPCSPEEGEFIVDHFDRVRNQGSISMTVYKVNCR